MDHNIHTWHELKCVRSKNKLNITYIWYDVEVANKCKNELYDISYAVNFDVRIKYCN